jgi:hypothetical protein
MYHPGHTATIEWATDNPSGGNACTNDRVMVIHHNKGGHAAPDGE